jgi:hypothetical protein
MRYIVLQSGIVTDTDLYWSLSADKIHLANAMSVNQRTL